MGVVDDAKSLSQELIGWREGGSYRTKVEAPQSRPKTEVVGTLQLSLFGRGSRCFVNEGSKDFGRVAMGIILPGSTGGPAVSLPSTGPMFGGRGSNEMDPTLSSV